MTHLLRTQPDAVWKIGYDVSGADLIDIDEKSKKAVNGDEGGLWLPSANVVIAGVGWGVAGPWDLSGVGASATGQIEFDEGSADDYFGLDVGHPETTIAVYQQLCEVYSELPETVTGTFAGPQDNPNISFTAGGVVTRVTGPRFCFPLRCRNGGRITSVIFTVQMTTAGASPLVPRAGLPAVMPRYAVFALDAAGNRLPLHSADASTDADGFISDAAATVGAYTTPARTITYACDQNNVVDKGAFAYFAEVIDESGANATGAGGNFILSTTALQGQIKLLDGRA